MDSSYDRVLAGGVGADGFTIAPYTDTNSTDRLFLPLVNAFGVYDSPARQPSCYRVVAFTRPCVLAGC